MNKTTLKFLTYIGIGVILLHFAITFAIRVSLMAMPNEWLAALWLNIFGINDLYQNIKFYEINPTLAPLNQFYYIASFILSGIATLIVGRGRNIIEILGIMISFAIPQKRKSWGKIYNLETNEPLPFASIRIIQNDENGHFVKVLQEIVSDVEGNYRISALQSEVNVVVQVRLSSFTTLEVPITQLKERTSSNDIIEDINLSSDTSAKGSFINQRQRFIKTIYKIVIILLYILSLVSVITISFYALRFELTLIALQYNLAVAIITLIWNTNVIFNLGKPELGMILDKETKLPISYYTIKVFKDNKQIFSKVIEKSGKIILPLPSGNYKADIFKEGYKSLNDIDLKINKSGYTKNNIYLEKDSKVISEATSGKLANPFS